MKESEQDLGDERRLGKISVSLVHEDIAAISADVLVNAANTQLHMGGGVAAALRARGGIEIHQEAIRHAQPARSSTSAVDFLALCVGFTEVLVLAVVLFEVRSWR